MLKQGKVNSLDDLESLKRKHFKVERKPTKVNLSVDDRLVEEYNIILFYGTKFEKVIRISKREYTEYERLGYKNIKITYKRY